MVKGFMQHKLSIQISLVVCPTHTFIGNSIFGSSFSFRSVLHPSTGHFSTWISRGELERFLSVSWFVSVPLKHNEISIPWNVLLPQNFCHIFLPIFLSATGSQKIKIVVFVFSCLFSDKKVLTVAQNQALVLNTNEWLEVETFDLCIGRHENRSLLLPGKNKMNEIIEMKWEMRDFVNHFECFKFFLLQFFQLHYAANTVCTFVAQNAFVDTQEGNILNVKNIPRRARWTEEKYFQFVKSAIFCFMGFHFKLFLFKSSIEYKSLFLFSAFSLQFHEILNIHD